MLKHQIKTIYVIFPNFPTPFRLVDVIKSFGDPKYVVASALRNPEGNGVSYDLRRVAAVRTDYAVKKAKPSKKRNQSND